MLAHLCKAYQHIGYHLERTLKADETILPKSTCGLRDSCSHANAMEVYLNHDTQHLGMLIGPPSYSFTLPLFVLSWAMVASFTPLQLNPSWNQSIIVVSAWLHWHCARPVLTLYDAGEPPLDLGQIRSLCEGTHASSSYAIFRCFPFSSRRIRPVSMLERPARAKINL